MKPNKRGLNCASDGVWTHIGGTDSLMSRLLSEIAKKRVSCQVTVVYCRYVFQESLIFIQPIIIASFDNMFLTDYQQRAHGRFISIDASFLIINVSWHHRIESVYSIHIE